jgi:hypothetical protein
VIAEAHAVDTKIEDQAEFVEWWEAKLSAALCQAQLEDEHASITAATADLTAVLPSPDTLSLPLPASAGALRAPLPFRLT